MQGISEYTLKAHRIPYHQTRGAALYVSIIERVKMYFLKKDKNEPKFSFILFIHFSHSIE